MVRINPRSVIAIAILSALLICLAGCGNKTKFSGSKTGNDNQFLVDFDVLNTTVEGNMPLTKGDTVETTIDIKKGDADVIVVNENGTIAYQGNDVETGNFAIGIEEDGIYTFSISGDNAEGSILFIKSQTDTGM